MAQNPTQSRQPLGIAVIGAGRIGTMRSRLAAEHPAVNFIAVSDLNRDAAQALADKAGAQFVTSDNDEAIAHPSVNTVIVSTSEHQHTAAVLKALQLGKHVLVEKPIALKLDDADAILRALETSQGSLHVGYSRRFKRRYLLAKEQITQGRLGQVTGMSLRIYNSRAQVFAQLQRDPHATPVVDSLTYFIDFINWWLPGNPVREVWARGQGGVIRDAGYDCDDVTHAVLTLDDGALVSCNVSSALPAQYPSLGYCARIEIIGKDGVLLIDDDHMEQLLYTEKKIPHIYLPEVSVNMAFLGSSAPGDWAGGEFWGPLANETRNWLDHVATGKPCALTRPQEARSNLEVTLAIEEAVRTGETVRLAR
jgi:predicted dehydrogenase